MASEKLLLLSDFNIDVLGRYAAKSDAFAGYECAVAPYGQVYQTLSRAPDEDIVAAIVWTLPAGVVPSFAKAADFEAIDAE